MKPEHKQKRWRTIIYILMLPILGLSWVVFAASPISNVMKGLKTDSSAQNPPAYKITVDILAEGGGVSNSSSYKIVDTFGTAIESGQSASPNFKIDAGSIPSLYPDGPLPNTNMIIAPENGAVTISPAITVTGITAANASIVVQTADHVFNSNSDGSGHYTVPNIPIIMGPNKISSESTDVYGNIRATNVGITRTIYLITGTLVSRIHDVGQNANWETISWLTVTPTNTNITFRTRSGNSPSPDVSWSNWSAVYTVSGSTITSPPGQYIQYEALFSTSDSIVSPTLDEVIINYEISSYIVSIGQEGDNINLNWAPVSGAVSYNIYRETTPYFTPISPVINITETNYTDIGAAGNTDNYYYLVTAVDSSGEEIVSLTHVGKFVTNIQPGQ